MKKLIQNSKLIIKNLITPILIILLFSCSPSTGTQTGSLSGTVQLEGQSDHSGIIIGVYELAELDSDIVEANTEWPHIGVIINQHTEFDHRFGTLVKIGETNASGNFEITDIPTGVYNIVAIKDGFGFKYIYEVDITSGDNSLPNSKNGLTLYSETIVNLDISNSTIWQTDHHYIIEQDIILDDELTIEAGAVIRLNEGKEITSYGTFNAVGGYENFIWFTKNEGISENLNTIEPDSNYIWDRVTLKSNSQAQVQWCKFDWANIGLLNYVNGFEISDCIFRESQCGFKAESSDSAFCSNLLCDKISKESLGGIFFYCLENGTIEKNVLKNCENGIKISDESGLRIESNYLSNCSSGIYISFDCEPIILNNNFNSCNIGICNYRNGCGFQILYNTINCTHGINSYFHIYGTLDIHKNNFQCGNYFIKQGSGSWTIFGENNYYFTLDVDEIEEKIFDKNDVDPSQQQYYGEVLYEPFLTEKNPYAGIQNEKKCKRHN